MEKKTLLLVCLLSVSQSIIYAQHCGTEPTVAQVNFMKKMRSILRQKNDEPLVQIPVKIHVLRRSDGTGGISDQRVTDLIGEMNAEYAPANMEFFISGGINYINNTTFFDLDQSEENSVAGPNDVSNTINIYFSNTLTAGPGGLCGYTRFPPSADRIFMANGCSNNVTTMAHEMGHYFTLYHTHGKTNTGTTDELVARVNCDQLGDDLCDTPADPNLSGVQNGTTCAYVGGAVDAQGVPFQPLLDNFMSYGLDQCQDSFTQEQYDRIRVGFEFGRNYLNYITPDFTARFSVSTRLGCFPLTITFTDNTASVVSRRWEFNGANIATAFSQSVNVTYNTPGSFNVRLIVESNTGVKDTLTRNNYITILDKFQDVVTNNSNVSENFNSSELPSKWKTLNPDQTLTFGISNSNANTDGSKSIWMNNYGYAAEVLGQVDNLIVPNQQLGEISSIKIKFDYAYTYNLNEITEISKTDTLKVGYQLDCSDDIFPLWAKGGQALATAPTSSTAFVPTSTQWQNQEINIDLQSINNIQNNSVFKTVFSNVSYNGNNLYLDNIQVTPNFGIPAPTSLRVKEMTANGLVITWADISFNELNFVIERSTNNQDFTSIGTVSQNIKEFTDNTVVGGTQYYYRVKATNSKAASAYSNTLSVEGSVTSVEDNIVSRTTQIYPNPSDGLFYIKMENNLVGNVSIELFDSFGKKYGTTQFMKTTDTQIRLFRPLNLPEGLYFVKITFRDTYTFKKIIINK
jgi:PKD repeat protein